MKSDELILARLRGGQWVSGEALAAELGISRAAVGKHVTSLRARGFVIDAQVRRGYRLLEEPDSLEPAVLAPLLGTRWAGQEIDWAESCSSTNDRAAERARSGARHGLVVVAEAQRRGRGRVGRSWYSPPRRNVYLSLVVRPNLAPIALPPLALAVGVAAHEALGQLGVEVDLKWPNDLWSGGRKLGGILIEMSSELSRVAFAIVGIGVNVNLRKDEIPSSLREIATSMAIAGGRSFRRAEVAARLCERIEAWYDRFVAEGPAPAARAFKAAAQATLGRRVRIADSGLEGMAEDISDGGALLLRDDTGRVHEVVAGEVLL